MRVDINANELDADIHLNIIKQQNTKMFIKNIRKYSPSDILCRSQVTEVWGKRKGWGRVGVDDPGC